MNPIVRKDLEFVPVRHEGRVFVLIRDSWGLVPEARAIPAWLFQFLLLMDGSRSLRDLQVELMQLLGGRLVSTDEIAALTRELESQFILDGPLYREALEGISRDYMRDPLRRPFSVGKAYPAEPEALRTFLGEMIRTRPNSGKKVKAIIAPHIDLRVGGRVYGEVYGRLAGSGFQDVMILGVGHQMDYGLFSVSTKDFMTPLGILKNMELASEFLGIKEPLVTSEIYHRAEHSIEFQTLFLKYLFPEKDLKVLPVLCGNVAGYIEAPKRDLYRELCAPFIEQLFKVLKDNPETLIVAGIDLSHIGPKFGDPYPARSLEGGARAHDRAILDAVMSRDPERLWDEHRTSEGRYKVCGFSVLALLLEILDDYEAELVGYEMWNEEPTQSAVSYSGVIFYECVRQQKEV